MDSLLHHRRDPDRNGSRQAVGRTAGIRERFRALVKDKPRALGLVDALFINPCMTVARAAALLRVSNPTARKAVGFPATKGCRNTWAKSPGERSTCAARSLTRLSRNKGALA
jgi:hypothetical protein